MGVETQCEGGATHQPRGGYGIATSKQRDIVSEFDEFLREVRYDAFGATVKPRWNAFHQRRYLSDFHFSVSLWNALPMKRYSVSLRRKIHFMKQVPILL